MAEEKVVLMCAECMRQFGLESNFKKAAEKGIRFSHTLCPRHFVELMVKSGLDIRAAEKGVKDSIAKHTKLPPDLSEHPELVKQYKNDIFTPEEYRNVAALKEMLQKRAGILHS